MTATIIPGVGTPRTNSSYILTQSAVPVFLVPSGTVAVNGTILLLTALPATYSNGIWIYLPAGAVVGGSAGLYYCVMSSTTAGQVYTNFADPATEWLPTIPSGALVAAVGSNVPYVQTTGADITLINITVHGGVMRAYSSLRCRNKWLINNTAGVKQGKWSFGGSLAQTTGSLTTSVGRHEFLSINNKGVLTSQSAGSDNSGSSTAFNANNRLMAINTANNVALTLTGQLAVATDYIAVDHILVEVAP